ncbi:MULTISPECIES: SDR family oxidoreductase [Alteromonas]|jgi:NAD(P)-dependent dehydrogenase (short-subunit alcohol dehydrogenase family)|uniref:Oxidoreductase n=1 Tax=Alteromonas stellipolaris TaxID=233316 RepID=A0AAW7Z1L7_9ALTE|nr:MULTISPECIES: SDR family oxidoreductase [Alteromonas]AMJ89467.1 oxidoreductase [Alteromonas sp. Mac2]ALM90298.1 oxidoreductase yajO1 [Alteromonas stellipolaris LMG 21856]AMJ74685.1 oxidoreductase [Alteromonas stellipolaris]AMJ85633.1 oxidoreductase [Alteromonas sp. Mac1]ANB23942.1 oxidoreductase [Alteromonas stellipolaris]
MAINNQFGPKGWTPERLGSLTGKTFLITGANTGAGFQATRILLSKGANVVMLNRNPSKSEAAMAQLKSEFGDEAKVSFIQLDLAELASVRRASKEILEKVPKIDALVCNGAIAQIATQQLTVDGFESQLGVNHYGHFLLCGLLFERIEASEGRIVVVSSEGHKMGLKAIQFDDMNWDKNYHPNKVYSQSKLAQMMFAYELQDKIKAAGKNVKVYVCHPGASNTSLIRESASFMTRISWAFMVKIGLAQTAEKGAYPEVMCATEENLKERAYYGPTGIMNFGGPVGEGKLESFVLQKDALTRLWALSEKETAIDWPL